MKFKAKALLSTPHGVHFDYLSWQRWPNIVQGKEYLVTIEEAQPEPTPEPEPEKPFAASVVTTQNPWTEG